MCKIFGTPCPILRNQIATVGIAAAAGSGQKRQAVIVPEICVGLL